MNNILKDNIKKQLSLRKMSVSELERRAGLKQSTLQNIINGRSKNPSVDTIKSIAHELDCTIEELISELRGSSVESPPLKQDEKECEWNAKLFIEAIEIVQEIVDSQQLRLPKKQMLASADEIYKYSVGVSDKIDKRFAEWILEKIVRKEGATLF